MNVHQSIHALLVVIQMTICTRKEELLTAIPALLLVFNAQVVINAKVALMVMKIMVQVPAPKYVEISWPMNMNVI